MNPRVVLVASVATVALGITIALYAAADTEDVLRVAFLPSVSHAIPIVGMERGTFAAALDPMRIEARILDSGTQAVQSLLSGNLELAYVGPGPAVNAFVRSPDKNIVIISGAASGGVSLVAREGSGISGIADLDGKRVAVPQVANSQDVSLRHHLAEAGLEPAERGGGVHVIAVAGPEMHTLLSRGSIDAAWAPEPWATLLVESLGATRVLEESELWPDSKFSSVVLVARADYAQERPGEVASWLGAHEETAAWIAANPEGAKAEYASFAQDEALAALPADILAESFSHVDITTDALEGSISAFAERSAALGYLGRSPPGISGIFYGGSAAQGG